MNPNQGIALLRRLVRRFAVRFLGLPHSVGEVDSPDLATSGDITELWKSNSNPFNTRKVVDPSTELVVSLTTYGLREKSVWLVIESICRGNMRPNRLILWLDSPNHRLGYRLSRLKKRGLEIKFTDATLGAYKKFWPYLNSVQDTKPLVICDDDQIYPPDWLQLLSEVSESEPDCIVAFRAHKINMTMSGDLKPYSEWTRCESAAPSYRHFGTTNSGQLLPVALLDYLRARGDEFLILAPKADDVWIHAAAVSSQVRIRQVGTNPIHFPFVPNSQKVTLYQYNGPGGGNDVQLRAVHNKDTLARIAGSDK